MADSILCFGAASGFPFTGMTGSDPELFYAKRDSGRDVTLTVGLSAATIAAET
jgi:hypothetical protein